MARMYSRKHGKSGSTRPSREEPPEWMNLSEEEVKERVVELAKEGKKPSQIGRILRDELGVPSVKYFGKKITQILEEEGLGSDLPENMKNLIERAEKVRGHLEDNPRDSSAVHGLEQIESKIRRLKQHFKQEGKIPEDWEYEPAKEFHKRE